jgi:hypothetical protein
LAKPNRVAAFSGLIALAALGGCATNEYVAPQLPDNAVAIVEVGETELFNGTTPLAVDEIDGADGGIAYDQIVPLSTQEYRLLPGTHSFVFDAPATNGLFDNPPYYQRIEVTATLAANKRYRFVGREPSSAKGLTLGAFAGNVPVHVEMVDETDGGTVQYAHEVPPGAITGPNQQPIAANSDGGMRMSMVSEPPPAPPPPVRTYDFWNQQNQGTGSRSPD